MQIRFPFVIEPLEDRVLLSVGTGLRADYYTYATTPGFDALALTRNDPAINFDWGVGAPDAAVPADQFAVRWTGQIEARSTEMFTFYTQTDQGVRLWVNNQLLIDNWTSHTLTEKKGTIALVKGQKYDIKMEYYDATGTATAKLLWSTPTWVKEVVPTQYLTPSGTGLRGEYFDNADLTNRLVTRVDPTVNFDFGNGSPDPSIAPDMFSARWTGQIIPRYSENYTFHVTADDGVRLWVNGQKIVDDWTNHYATTDDGTIALQAGQAYDIRLEYFEGGGGAQVKLEWESASQTREVVPQTQLYNDPAGGLLREYWTGIGGTTVAQLTSNKSYPNNPTGGGDILDFEAPSNFADQFGERLRGYVRAPLTGAYTFFISSDDQSQLFLSNDTDPANKRLIASVTGYTSPRQWDKYPSQKSVTINLVAGQEYYIEALHKEGGGGDNLAVGWQLPDGTQELPIPNFRLSPVLPQVQLWATDSNADEASGKPATFTVSRDTDLGRPLTVNYIVGGSAQSGSDYTPVTGSVVIPKGSSTATFAIAPINDAIREGNETIHVALSPSPDYALGELSTSEADANIIDDELPVPGTSVLPANAIHNLTLTGSAYGTATIVPVTGMPFTEAMEVRNTVLPTTIDNFSLIVQTNAPVNAGDVMMATFWVRNLNTADAYATINYRDNATTVPRDIDYWARVTPTWQRYDVPFTANLTSAAGGARIELRLGFPPQAIQVAGVALLDFGTSIKVSDLPQAQGSYNGRDPSATWRAAAQQRIDQYRKADLNVVVKDANGNPIDGALVQISQTDSSYGWGASVRGDPPDILLNGTNSDVVRYRGVAATLFNKVTIESNLKWFNWAANRTRAINDVNWAQGNDMSVRGHMLVDGLWQTTPQSVRTQYDAITASQGISAARIWLNQQVLAHVTDEVTALKGKIDEWDVYNEPFNNTPITQLGIANQASWFTAAHQADPSVGLFLNDYALVTHFGQRRDHDKNYYDTLNGLIAHGAPITGLGLQSHSYSAFTGMDDVNKILNKLSSYKLNLQATEFEVSGADDQLQSDYMRDYMTMFYSMPQSSSMVMLGFWQTNAPFPDGAIFRPDWTVKPDGQMWMDQVEKIWHTDATGTTWMGGNYKTRAYLGDYNITVTYGGQTQTVTESLDASGKTVQVVLGGASSVTTAAAKNTASPSVTQGTPATTSATPTPATTTRTTTTSTTTTTAAAKPKNTATFAASFITPSRVLDSADTLTSKASANAAATFADLFA